MRSDQWFDLASPSPSQPKAQETAAARANYRAPRLTALGDLRTVTLGPSVGTGESGNPGLFRA